MGTAGSSPNSNVGISWVSLLCPVGVVFNEVELLRVGPAGRPIS